MNIEKQSGNTENKPSTTDQLILIAIQKEKAQKRNTLIAAAVVVVIVLLIAINSGGDKNPKVESGLAANKTQDSTISDNKLAENEKDINYEITREDNDATGIIMDIYIPDTTKVKGLNDILIHKYNSDKSKAAMIMYFDDKAVAKVWPKKVKDDIYGKVTKAEWKKLEIHRIAVYHFNPSNGYEELAWDHRDE